MARRCVFCGNAGLTREHVIPRWLTDVLPEQARFRGQDQMAVLLHPDHAVDGPHHREMPETFNSSTVKTVCGSCNNGFMNDIETVTRPYLSTMIRGRLAMPLSVEAVTAVATWAVKTSLMAQLTGSEPASIDRVYQDFYATRRPTDACLVWAAAIDDEDWALRAECRLMLYVLDGPPANGDDPPNLLTVAIGLGGLLLYTIIDPVLGPSTWNPTAVFRGALVPLWPDPRPVTWPPSRVLRPAEAWGVCEYMPMLLG
ncbi:hypothetical protein ACQEVZ_51535 [Dactylosporangium sp. CA-152071]|uniref:hypothetical protein n=1 Tax=Dactylosporangium sp. CA-152071 TaxID=3239933 RepID=UPI003D8B6CE1